MIIRTSPLLAASEITDEAVFLNRRKLLKSMMLSLGAASGMLPVSAFAEQANIGQVSGNPVGTGNLSPISAKLVKSYNNYYEFAFDKESVAESAQKLVTDPWAVEISGEVEKPGIFPLEDILRQLKSKEHIYRFRCVEGWSMVVPWQGVALADLLKSVQPLSSAKFVKFTSVAQAEAMPNVAKKAMLSWPYVEGLRIDEAMHPLTILASGMYGKPLPKQNGAPLRLVVPWKYGFKSIKAIVKIELMRHAPLTSWNQFAPDEYGFYANVNPQVPHPRWSQSSERLLGSGFFTPRRATELFNGYGVQVASLYSGMDLRHFF